MGYKLYDFQCTDCLLVEEHLCSKEDISAEAPPKLCPVCGTEMFRRMPAPSVRTDNNSASYVDGTKRPGFAEGKEAARLNVLKAQAGSAAEKAEIAKEIKKTGFSLGSDV